MRLHRGIFLVERREGIFLLMSHSLLTAQRLTVEFSDRICHPSKSVLFRGVQTGGAFFLAWTLGACICYSFKFLLFYCKETDAMRVAACVLCLSVWQAMILFSSWWRRMCSILIFYFLVIPSLDPANLSVGYDPVLLAAFFQAALLINVRKRVLLLVILAILANPMAGYVVQPLMAVYDFALKLLLPSIPAVFILPFSEIYPVLMTIAFGSVVALFMPPIERCHDGMDRYSV
jgi:hypothetical protein